jgi:hypothetical protein
LKSSLLGGAAVLLLVVGACSGGPTDPRLPVVEILVASGDGQFGALGQALPVPLQALVRTASSGTPRKDVGVFWQVMEGEADFTGSPATLTDESGSAFASLRLGSVPGEVVVRATVTEQESVTVDFTLFAVDRPTLNALSADQATAGATISLSGNSFSPTADHNVVLFSGIRGRVTSAGPSQLDVVVPTCLPTRSVQVTVQLGAVKSESRTLAVLGGAEMSALDVGDFLDVADAAGFSCPRVPGLDDARYLVLAQSASMIGAAQHAFELTGLSDGASTRARRSALARSTQSAADAPPFQIRFEDALRRREAGLLRERVLGTHEAPQRTGSAVPSVGDQRTFHVLNVDSEFDEVVAVAQYVGSHGVLYVDETAPAGGLSQVDLAAFGRRFDDVIYTTITAAFGSESDLDGNDRVVILFTPSVNRLTPKGSNGFVGGFYYGLDLLPDREGSNAGEVFYALVPDPSGLHSDPRAKARVLEVTPAVLAHEFQHMVHFNQRVLALEAASSEALWLSEGMAQMAEELVAREYEDILSEEDTELFREGNTSRARQYLFNPADVSLIVATGRGSLAERGAGWLFVLYLTAQKAEGILGQLTRTTNTGTDNVVARMGLPWEEILADWWAALYLDGEASVGSRLTFPGLELRDLLGTDYVLEPEPLPSMDFIRSGSLWSSSAQYYIVIPTLHGSVTLRLGGEGGGASPSGAALRMRVVRLN